MYNFSLKLVTLIAAGAGGFAIIIKIEPLAMFTHPANLAGRVANNEGIGFDFFGNNGSSTDKGVCSDVVTTDDGGIGANGGTFSHDGFHVFALAVDGAAGVINISENHGRAQEHVVFTDDSFVDRDIVLHLDVVAEHDAVCNEYVLAEVAVFPNDGSRHDVAEVPYFTTCPNLGALINNGGRMNEARVAHAFFCFF